MKTSPRKSHKNKFVRKSFSQQYTTPESFLLKKERSHNVRLAFSILELMMLEFCVLSIGLKGGYNKTEKVAELFNCCIDYYNRSNKKQKLSKRSLKEIRQQMEKLDTKPKHKPKHKRIKKDNDDC